MKKLLSALVMAFVVLTFGNVATSYGYENLIFMSNRSERTADMKLSFMCTAGEKSYGDNIIYHLSPLQDIDIRDPLEECLGNSVNSELSTKFSADLTIQGSNNLVSIKIVTSISQMGSSQSCEVIMEGSALSPSIVREGGRNDCRITLLYQ